MNNNKITELKSDLLEEEELNDTDLSRVVGGTGYPNPGLLGNYGLLGTGIGGPYGLLNTGLLRGSGVY